MGHITHTVIVVTSWDETAVKGLYDVCLLNQTNVSEPKMSRVNGYWTFVMIPSGSKSGYPDAREADRERAFLKDLLRTYRDTDESTPMEWFECAYGSDDKRALVVDSEWTEHASTQAVRK